MAQADPVPNAYIPSPNRSGDRNLDALFVQNKPAPAQPEDRHSAFVSWNKRYSPADVHTEKNPRQEAKRAKAAVEWDRYEGREGEYLRCEEGGIENEMYYDDVNGMAENESEADDEATVDEEEWEQEPLEGECEWEGTYEEDGEVAIKSEDEV